MGSWRESALRRRDIRQSGEDQRPLARGSKRPRDVWTEERYIGPKSSLFFHWYSGDWRRHRRYRTLGEAEQAVVVLNRKHTGVFEYRLKPLE